MGYQVTVTELVGWEHSMKNELILARYTGHKKRSAAKRLKALLQEFGLEALLDNRFTLPADNSPDNRSAAPRVKGGIQTQLSEDYQ